MTMEDFARRQEILNNARTNLNSLYAKGYLLLDELSRINKQIEKHLNFIKELEDKDN